MMLHLGRTDWKVIRMRLIDADKVIEELDGYSLSLEVNPSMTTGDIIKKTVEICNAYFMKVINEQPTAYDVEAVVQRLEWLKYDDYECEENGCQGEFCIQCTLDKAIEIVRGGRND